MAAVAGLHMATAVAITSCTALKIQKAEIVSFFMNRSRKLGSIEYNGRIHVNKSLLNVILQDQLFEHNAIGASLFADDAKGSHGNASRKPKLPA